MPSEEEWFRALENLDLHINLYAELEETGYLALENVLKPLKRRYESGERTQELYLAMMDVA